MHDLGDLIVHAGFADPVLDQETLTVRWTRAEVDTHLRDIMKQIHKSSLEAAERYGTPGNYVAGANIAGFLKVADAMLDQGYV